MSTMAVPKLVVTPESGAIIVNEQSHFRFVPASLLKLVVAFGMVTGIQA